MSREYNKYPEGFLEPFKKKTTFRLVDIKPDPDNPGAYLMPSVTAIPPSSTVVYKGQEVHLALVASYDENGNMIPDDRSMMLGQFNNGELTLDPRKPKHVAMFNYINHSHHNRSSPYTFPGAKHYVEKVDHEAFAAKESASLDIKRAALMTVSVINESQVQLLAEALLAKEPANSPLSNKVRRANLDKLADKYPEKILDACKSLSIPVAHIDGAAKEEETVAASEVEIDPFIGAKVKGLIKSGEISQINVRKEFKNKETGKVIFQWGDGEGSPVDKLVSAVAQDNNLLEEIESM